MRVLYDYRSRLSGALLADQLKDVDGPDLNWGYPRGGAINQDDAIKLASNKRLALKTMAEAGVPTPRMFTVMFENVTGNTLAKPVIGRPDRHKGGSGFYFCRTMAGVNRAKAKGATHFLEFIPEAREFRVHVAFGKSIKIAEKIGNGNRKSFKRGAEFVYPDFNHKKSLRRYAKQAVASLGLDFGAVDILYKDDKYYVLEVNTAPSLTSASDVIDRYVKAFKEANNV